MSAKQISDGVDEMLKEELARLGATQAKCLASRVRERITRNQIIDWLANGWVGCSSKTMAIIALGSTPNRIDYPYDPDDLNRCLLLLEAAPGVRDAFPKIAAANKVWAALIANWSEIERLFLEEAGPNWSKARSAPKTYALMRSVIDGANRTKNVGGAS